MEWKYMRERYTLKRRNNITGIDFGSYVKIEQKRYGCKNEMYLYKVIGRLKSNAYVDVPVQSPEKESLHKKMVEIAACICCGVNERQVNNFKLSDIKKEKEV